MISKKKTIYKCSSFFQSLCAKALMTAATLPPPVSPEKETVIGTMSALAPWSVEQTTVKGKPLTTLMTAVSFQHNQKKIPHMVSFGRATITLN